MLRISREGLRATLSQLHSEAPNEGVGLWVGKKGRVTQVIPLPNTHPRPSSAYNAEPEALIHAVQGLEREGLELLAIYHSHPKGPARPSQTDKTQAFWRVPYVIFALETGEWRAYKLPEGEEVMVNVEG
ncbi:MAG: metal-dependent protease of the PAD1/JAB1 superfamily [Meiothermus sp.]